MKPIYGKSKQQSQTKSGKKRIPLVFNRCYLLLFPHPLLSSNNFVTIFMINVRNKFMVIILTNKNFSVRTVFPN